jgi:hypothetical protein
LNKRILIRMKIEIIVTKRDQERIKIKTKNNKKFQKNKVKKLRSKVRKKKLNKKRQRKKILRKLCL